MGARCLEDKQHKLHLVQRCTLAAMDRGVIRDYDGPHLSVEACSSEALEDFDNDGIMQRV